MQCSLVQLFYCLCKITRIERKISGFVLQQKKRREKNTINCFDRKNRKKKTFKNGIKRSQRLIDLMVNHVTSERWQFIDIKYHLISTILFFCHWIREIICWKPVTIYGVGGEKHTNSNRKFNVIFFSFLTIF